jgi:hypothetical protein
MIRIVGLLMVLVVGFGGCAGKEGPMGPDKGF